MSNGLWLIELVILGFSICWTQNEARNVNNEISEKSWIQRLLLSQEKSLPDHPKTLSKPLNTRPVLRDYYKTLISGIEGDDNNQLPSALKPYFSPKGWERYQNPFFFTTPEPKLSKTPHSNKIRKDVFDFGSYLGRWKEKPSQRKSTEALMVDSVPVSLRKNSTNHSNSSHPFSTEEPFSDFEDSTDSISRALSDPSSVISIQELLLQGIRNNNQESQIKPILFQPSRGKHPWKFKDLGEQNDTCQQETTDIPTFPSVTPPDRSSKQTSERQPTDFTTCGIFVNISGNNLTNVNQSWVVYVSGGGAGYNSSTPDHESQNDTKPTMNALLISKLQELERSLIEMEIEVQKSKKKIAELEANEFSQLKRPGKNQARDFSLDWYPVRKRQDFRRKAPAPRLSRWWMKTRPEDTVWPSEIVPRHSQLPEEAPVESVARRHKLSEKTPEEGMSRRQKLPQDAPVAGMPRPQKLGEEAPAVPRRQKLSEEEEVVPRRHKLSEEAPEEVLLRRQKISEEAPLEEEQRKQKISEEGEKLELREELAEADSDSTTTQGNNPEYIEENQASSQLTQTE